MISCCEACCLSAARYRARHRSQDRSNLDTACSSVFSNHCSSYQLAWASSPCAVARIRRKRRVARWRAPTRKMDLRSYNHGYGQLSYHIVTAPKYRFDIFRDLEIKSACERIFREIAEAHGFTIYELEVMPDHIHLFVGFGPNMCPSKAVQLFKGISARKLFQEFPRIRRRLWGGHLWSKGKFCRSVGNVTSEVVEYYIRKSQGSWDFFDTPRTYGDWSQIKLRAY